MDPNFESLAATCPPELCYRCEEEISEEEIQNELVVIINAKLRTYFFHPECWKEDRGEDLVRYMYRTPR